MTRWLVLGLALLPMLLSGCVLKSKYDEALMDMDGVRAELATCQTDMDRLGGELESCSVAKKRALDQIDDLIAKLEAAGEDVSRLQSERTAIADELQLAEQELAELERKRRAEQERLATFRQMLEQFRAMIDSGQVEVKIERGRMVVKMASSILFDSGRTDLKTGGQDVLSEVTVVLAGLANRSFQVEGHTDDQPINTARFPSNWELSAARAIEVVKFMTQQGMPAERISAAGFAEFMPVATNEDADGRALNRRIEIVLLPRMDELPDLSALEQER